MIYNDFTQVFWQIGQAILQGRDPYLVHGNFYPPAANYFFIFFAFLPVEVSFTIWVFVNVLCVIFFVIKYNNFKSYIWFGFSPVVFVLATGQLDLFLLALSTFIKKNGWVSALAGALITLKPQLAFVLLPWILIHWLIRNRNQLLRWIVLTVVLHLSPLLIDPLIYQRWWTATTQVSDVYILRSPGILSLSSMGIPVAALIPFAAAMFIYGFFIHREGSIITNLLALPFGAWYELVLLVGMGHAGWMILTSWVAFGLAFLLKGPYPFILIPLVAFFFLLKENKGFRFSFLSET